MELRDKVAIITGGARGIGEGIARCLSGQGSRVAVVDMDGDAASATASSLGRDAIGIAADVSDERQVLSATSQVVEAFGGLDFLVNNAGGGRDPSVKAFGPPLTNVDQAGWDEHIEVNLRTAFLCSKAAIPHLKERGEGCIVNISSVAALLPSPFLPAYAAAKAGVLSLTRTLALELAPFNIRVNAICPGLLWTRVWEYLSSILKENVDAYRDKELREIFLEQVRRAVPLQREQTPEDIGHLVAFLCSPQAQNITGQVIAVDGGMTLATGRT